MKAEKHKVFITGMGIISALGIGVSENLNRLINGKTGKMNLDILPITL